MVGKGHQLYRLCDGHRYHIVDDFGEHGSYLVLVEFLNLVI